MIFENELIPYEEESLNSQVLLAETEETTRLQGEVKHSTSVSIRRQYRYVKKIKVAIHRVYVEGDYSINQKDCEFQEEEEEEEKTK